MIEELKSIELIKKRRWLDKEHLTSLCEIIEATLKDIDEIMSNHNCSNLSKLNEKLCDYEELKFDDDIKQIKLKALEIIKDSIPIEEEDFFYDKETDTYFFIGHKVSKEQFYLLKEVLL